MTKTDQAAGLAAAALAVREHAHAPYSGFRVGAALLTENDRIFAGANVENAAYPESQCAEASAIGQMVSAGERRIVAAAIAGDGAVLITPCGGCRQRLAEFAAPDTQIHLIADGKIQRTLTMAELLPFGFGPATLGR
jgi:cytidine deaminase